MNNATDQKGLRQEEIDKLKLLTADWETQFRSHITISSRMDGIPGKGMVEYAGAIYFDCARKLSKEIKNLEGLNSTKVSETEK